MFSLVLPARIFDIRVDNVERKDYPDFSNAYISEAWTMEGGNPRELTEAELDYINNTYPEFVHEQATKSFF